MKITLEITILELNNYSSLLFFKKNLLLQYGQVLESSGIFLPQFGHLPSNDESYILLLIFFSSGSDL